MLAITPTPVLFSVRDSAAILGISYQQVLAAIRAGTLPAVKVAPNGKSWYLHAEDLDKFARGLNAPTSVAARVPLNPR